jgi:polysaccharide transporter, PST family
MLRNFLHLSLLRGINMISPFILYPFVIQTIGMEKWGYLTTAFAVTTYLSLIGDYGFHQSAIRESAAYSQDKPTITSLYWTITIAKPFLVLGMALVLFVCTGLYTNDWPLACVWFSGVFISLGESSNPVWLFQGLQQMQNLVYSNLVARLIGLCLVLWFVRSPEHYYFTLPLLGIGAIIGALFSHVVLLPRLGMVQPMAHSHLAFKQQFRAGYPFFMRNLALSVYSNIPVFFLTATAPAVIVGYFGVADRIVAMLKAVLSVFSHAIFPKLVELKPGGHSALTKYLRKFFTPYLAGVTAASAILFLFAEPIIRLYSGVAETGPIVPVLRAMAFLPVSLALAQPMDALMQVYGREKLLSRLLWAAGGINFVLNLYLIPHQMAFGAALSLFITETAIVFLFLWLFEWKYRNEAYFLTNS